MRALIDSHILIWAVDTPEKLGRNARALLEDASTEVLVSAVTLWEVAIKVGLGKLTLSLPYEAWMARAVFDLRAEWLPITVAHAGAQVALPWRHRDPFDRMLVAQAQVEDIALVSRDESLQAYGIRCIW